MQFQSKMWRSAWAGLALWLIIDGAIAYGLASLSDSAFGDPVVQRALIYFAVIQVATILLWIKKSAVSWLLFLVAGRRLGRKAMLATLKSSGYPEPDECYSGSLDYLESVMKDESLPVNIRLRAAADVASVLAPGQQGHVQRTMQLNMILEDALQAYKAAFPPKAASARADVQHARSPI